MSEAELHDLDWVLEGDLADTEPDWPDLGDTVAHTEPDWPDLGDKVAHTEPDWPDLGDKVAHTEPDWPSAGGRPPVDGSSARRAPAQPRRPATVGPLVAVCGLCGGAGASTIAYLTALSVARARGAAVVVCDTGGPGGGLAAYAGVQSPRSLPSVANAVAAHEPLAERLFASGAEGLRVMASRPAFDGAVDREGMSRVLRDARAAHSLSIVDCGLPRGETERQVLALASHVVWVLPATLGGARRAAATLPLFGLEASRREIVVARKDAAGRQAPTEELTRLAASRNAPLVLMPHVEDLSEQPAEQALDSAGLTLDAIQMAIRR